MNLKEQLLVAPKEKRVTERSKLVLGKTEEKEMPVFSREVPISTKRSLRSETITLTHSWAPQPRASEIDSIKIKQLIFRDGEDLEELSKINIRDGYDRVQVKYQGITYFLRKTSEDVARALFNAATKIKGSIERIVGYLSTMLGNCYVISVVEHGSWVFDEKLTDVQNDEVNLATVSSFDREHKEKLTEMVAEGLTNLHKKRLVLGKFDLNNVLLNAKELLFTDLRKMRVSRKSAFFVEEFVMAMRYLLVTGVATRADAVHAVMGYSVEMEDACNCWYRERNGRSAAAPMLVVEEMEKELVTN